MSANENLRKSMTPKEENISNPLKINESKLRIEKMKIVINQTTNYTNVDLKYDWEALSPENKSRKSVQKPTCTGSAQK